jgi:enoyl-CoA hydratase/carnithine racemase
LAPLTEFKVARTGDVALITIDNGEDWTKPTFFGAAALESLERALEELERGTFAAAVITGKPFFFAAGADITEFPGITRERAVEGARAGHELFGRLSALPFPTVAARVSAAASSSRSIAAPARSPRPSGTSRFPRCSSASSPRGAARSCSRDSSGRRSRSR